MWRVVVVVWQVVVVSRVASAAIQPDPTTGLITASMGLIQHRFQ